MPFSKRTVEPQRLCRQTPQAGYGGAHCAHAWSSLSDVSCTALRNLLLQLTDLSRHACSLFLEIQSETSAVVRRATVLQRRLDSLQDAVRRRNPKMIELPVSSLDEESKWSVHYTAPWHQQENVFLPGSRPPCVEELHLQAKVNLKTVLRECDKLRKDGFRSSQYYSQGPAFSSPILSNEFDQEETEKKKKSSDSAAEEEKLVYSVGPQTPLLDNICEINSQSNWSKSLPLPTPEEKMRQQAKSVATDIIPINITGESFDRQASFRRTLSNTDTVIRRSKKVKRRKTITGVPDNVQSELAAKGQNDIRTHSMYMAGQFSSIGHEGSDNSTLKHSDTRESGCQTEEAKTVPPSMRRIRAQRGCGIAAQMANITLCSSSMSGSISSMSDCNGAVYSPLRNSSDQGFHSLPRQGAQISLQKHEPNYTSTPYMVVNGPTSSLPYQVTKQHASPSSWHMSADPTQNKLRSPKAAEFQGFQNGHYSSTPCHMASSHSNSPAPFTSNGAMQDFCDLSSVHSAQSFDTVETQNSVLSGPSDQPFTTAGKSAISAGSSRCQSPASFHTTIHTETESQCSTLNGSNCNSPNGVRRGSNFSGSSTQSCSTLTIDQCTYESPPKGQHNSSCSSPVSHVYNSLERSPTKTDSSSLFSVDTEGYFTSMHMDSGLKSHSHGAINRAGNARHNIYDCREHHSQGDCVSLHSNQSLTRSISLRKAKKPPLPPKRTDSLRRKPHRKSHKSETVLSEQMISSLQKSLKNDSTSPLGQMPCSGFEDPWVLRPRSQSTVSAASSGMSASANMCPITPTHSDSSSQRSEYAESWDFYMDFPRSHSDNGPSSPNARSVSPGENTRGFTNEFSSDNCNRTRLKLNIVTSQDKVVNHVTSPSSGYSSQSITPTTGTPVTYVLRAKSPAGRPKPKVPERKSSLRSSVSSSTTSLSSNTSDSYKNLPTPPPLPTTLPGLATPQSAESVSSIPMSNSINEPSNFSTSQPPPPPLVLNCTLKLQSSPKLSPSTTEQCNRESSSISLGFPPPPSESSDSLMAEEDAKSPPSSPPPLPPPPPPPPLHRAFPSCNRTPPSPAPLPEVGLHAETILKATNSLTTMESEKSTEESRSTQPQERKRLQRPRITAQALQLVQLRPIKLMKLENIFTDIITTTVCTSQDQKPLQEPGEANQEPCSEKMVTETENLEDSSTPDSTSPFENEVKTQQSLEEEFTHYMLHSQAPSASGKPICRTYSVEFLLDAKSVSTPDSLQQSSVPCMATQSTSQKQKPPISPKKPGLALIMPPDLQKPILNSVEHVEVNGPEVPSSEQEVLNSVPLKELDDLLMIHSQLEAEVESESGNSTPVGLRRISVSSEFSSDSLTDPQFTAFIFTEHDLGLSDTDLGLSDKDLGLSDDKGITDDGSSSSSGSISFKEDENEDNGAVFDSSTDISSTTSSPIDETVEEMVTPARPRTTEDLFAAIHRSKKKLLGRGDSEEERSRVFPPSPPVTPTGACPSLPSLSRQTGFIQRNLRRSTTSNDSFKALLLKKGSRTDPGFRMSATEILKCTDPRLQRPDSESLELVSPCTSPGRSRRAAEEWARAEGALPRPSPSLMSLKYGRSSTPPSAASSRYNSRSRTLSGPMTAIFEKEGEVAEPVDCCLTAEIPFPMSLTSSGTVCAQGST